jgi:hypothetical protein
MQSCNSDDRVALSITQDITELRTRDLAGMLKYTVKLYAPTLKAIE